MNLLLFSSKFILFYILIYEGINNIAGNEGRRDLPETFVAKIGTVVST